MRTLRISLVLAVVAWVQGCERSLLAPDAEFRQIAWNDLTDAEKATVVGDWRGAPVEDASTLFPGREAVSVQFNTTQDPLLGPIVVF
ncbi:MAG TPA: hypothetical protein VGA99_12795, partial [bacterium]